MDNKGYNDYEGEGFLGILKETQTYLGPYSIKMAHDYIQKCEKKEHKGQEKISFVKMEYFLYAFGETYRCVQELKLMESKINQF